VIGLFSISYSDIILRLTIFCATVLNMGLSRATIVTLVTFWSTLCTASPVSAPRNIQSRATGKRGLAYNNNNPDDNATYANLFKGYSSVTWGYDWGYPSYDLDSSFEL
jgi:hypothetical protein